MEQTDYRANPSAATEPAQGHVDRDHPNPQPWTYVEPPYQPSSDQLPLGIEIPIQGWSRDLYAQTNPDVNPPGRRR